MKLEPFFHKPRKNPIDLEILAKSYEKLGDIAKHNWVDDELKLDRYKNERTPSFFPDDARGEERGTFDGFDNLIFYKVTSGISAEREVNPTEVFGFLDIPEQTKLSNLLKIFQNVFECWKNNSLKFKVDKIAKSKYLKSGKAIFVSDNVGGETAYFTPTITHITKVAKELIGSYDARDPKYQHSESVSGELNSPPWNSIVHHWSECQVSEFIFWTYGFEQLVTVEDKGYAVHAKTDKQFEETMSQFKSRFNQIYFPCPYSPLILEVRDLINLGFNRLKKNKAEKVDNQRLKALDSLKGRTF